MRLQLTDRVEGYAHNIGFGVIGAGRNNHQLFVRYYTSVPACWSNGHFIAVVLHLGWTYIVGLLFVNLYLYIFNQQRFRADDFQIPPHRQALTVVCYYTSRTS